jgi:hypothetical protein
MLKNIFKQRNFFRISNKKFYDTSIFRNTSVYNYQDEGKYDIKKNLTTFLKSLEIARTYDIRSNIYIEARQGISFLNDNFVKKQLSDLLTNEIKDRDTKDLVNSINFFNDKSKSYETIFDENYYNEFVSLFRELGKYLLKNDIYSLDHSVNLREDNKKILNDLVNVKSMVDDLKLKELNDSQMAKILPTLIIVNNIYNVESYVTENLINELMSRNGFEGYSNFLLVHNQNQNMNNLHHLVQLKDNILNSNNNVNDLLYILTDNIYKYVSTEHKTEDYNSAFWKFLDNFSKTSRYNKQNVNFDVLDNFMNALHLLVENSGQIGGLAGFVNGKIILFRLI